MGRGSIPSNGAQGQLTEATWSFADNREGHEFALGWSAQLDYFANGKFKELRLHTDDPSGSGVYPNPVLHITYGYESTSPGVSGPGAPMDSGRLKTITLEDPNTYTTAHDTTFTYSYLENTSIVSDIAGLRDASASNTHYTYDDDGLLTQMDVTSGSTLMYQIKYIYDVEGLHPFLLVARESTVYGQGTTTEAYTYDYMGHLATVTRYSGEYNAASTASPNESFGYDVLGNRVGTGYTLDSRNHYTLFDGNDTLAYDGRDDITAFAGTSYTYNALGQLIEATGNGSHVDDFSLKSAGFSPRHMHPAVCCESASASKTPGSPSGWRKSLRPCCSICR